MSELTTEQIIKITIGAFVVVLVVAGLAFYFKEQVISFFKNLPTGEIFLSLT